MINYLHGDHVWPYSLFGETSWGNYQLVCGDCNLSKGNRLDGDIRKALTTLSFREKIATYLNAQVASGSLSRDKVLADIIDSLSR